MTTVHTCPACGVTLPHPTDVSPCLLQMVETALDDFCDQLYEEDMREQSLRYINGFPEWDIGDA